jgi:hypothetical protein
MKNIKYIPTFESFVGRTKVSESIDVSKFESIDFEIKDYDDEWDTRSMNKMAKKHSDREWVELEVNYKDEDQDIAILMNDKMKKSLNGITEVGNKMIDFTSYMPAGPMNLYWDDKKSDFAIVTYNNDNEEGLFYFNKGNISDLEKFIES